MRRRITVSLIATAALVGALIGTSSAEEPIEIKQGGTSVSAAHCQAVASQGTCLEYASVDEATADCQSYAGEVATGACPITGRTGTCHHGGKTRHYYNTEANQADASGYAADYARRHCQNTLAGAFEPAVNP